jgi:hypothetical protein
MFSRVSTVPEIKQPFLFFIIFHSLHTYRLNLGPMSIEIRQGMS